jgi:hypothetical protein
MKSKSTKKIKRRSTSKSRTQSADLPLSYSGVEFLLINPIPCLELKAGALPFPTGREIIHFSGSLRPVVCALMIFSAQSR